MLSKYLLRQGDEMTDRFLKIMTNLAVSHSLGNETSAQRPSQLSYLALDAYVRLVVLLVNCKPLTGAADFPSLHLTQAPKWQAHHAIR